MAEKTTEVQIGGRQFKISQVGARTGNRIIFRGGQLFMQALAEGFASTADVSLGTILALLRRSTMADYDWICTEMQACTQVGIVDEKGDKRVTFVALDIDQHFAGRLMDSQDWLVEALKANFSDFLGEAVSRLNAWEQKNKAAKAAEEVAKTSKDASASSLPTPPTASGSSGASSSATS